MTFEHRTETKITYQTIHATPSSFTRLKSCLKSLQIAPRPFTGPDSRTSHHVSRDAQMSYTDYYSPFLPGHDERNILPSFVIRGNDASPLVSPGYVETAAVFDPRPPMYGESGAMNAEPFTMPMGTTYVPLTLDRLMNAGFCVSEVRVSGLPDADVDAETGDVDTGEPD